MPDLSACYFCGTALDEPLSEYPVVPKPLQPTADQQRTVVLCDGCRRKLGRVLDTVLEAVDERPIDASVQEGPGGGHDAVVDEAADLLDDESAASGDGDGADAATADADATVDEDDDADEDAKSDVSAAASATSGWSTVNVKHSSARRRSSADGDDDDGDGGVDDGDADDDASDTSESDGAGADDGDADDDASDTSESDGAGTEDGDDAAANEEASTSDTGDGGGSTGEAEDADEADGAGVTEDQTLSRLEYSKVMRLLENREFPVDREEIRVVATNAYEIRPEEYDAIVDAAVKRGLLVEENGKFVGME